MRRIATLMLALGLLLPWGLFSPEAHAQDERCFPETGQCISGRFREFWEQHGGLAVFGFPLTAAADAVNRETGQTYLTQWFERVRFELHPEQQRPYDVLLGRLGDDRLRQLGRDWQTFPQISGPPNDSCFFAQATGHAVCGDFLRYYRTHGLEFDGRRGLSMPENIALFGLPVSEAQSETGPDGKAYLIQWFERARFEYHPDEPDPYKVLLGRLGAEVSGAQPQPQAASQLAFLSRFLDEDDGDLYLVNSDGSGLIKIADTSAAAAPPAWSPDGKRIAFEYQGDIYAVGADGRNQVRLTSAGASNAEPVWSPDGKRILFTSRRDGNYELYLMNADGSNPVRLTNSPNSDTDAVWSPDGSRIAFASSTPQTTVDIYVINADGSNMQRLTTDGGSKSEPRWSPDGQQIAFATLPSAEQRGIFVINADGSQQRQLTTDGAEPVWSPDGKRIAFTTQRDGNQEIYVMNADGSAQTNLSNNPGSDTSPVWSPDGQSLAFVGSRERGAAGIFLMRADGSAQVRLTPLELAASAPMWRPQ